MLVETIRQTNSSIADIYDDAREREQTRNSLDLALISFLDRNYAQAAPAFEAVRQNSLVAKNQEALRGMVTASLFGAGAHREGLFYLCGMYQGRPAYDHRYRHDVHSHLRRLGVAEGFDTAERFLADLTANPQCARDDFTPVWIYLPIEHGWALQQSRYEGPLWEGSPDYKNLARFATGPGVWNDYALFARGEYETIIEADTFSYVRDMALFSMARQALKSTPQDFDRAIAALSRYIGDYPGAPRYSSAMHMLRYALAARGQFNDALNVDFTLISGGQLDADAGARFYSSFYNLYAPYWIFVDSEFKSSNVSELMETMSLGELVGAIDTVLEGGRDYISLSRSSGAKVQTSQYTQPWFTAVDEYTPEEHVADMQYSRSFAAEALEAVERRDFDAVFRIATALKDCGDSRELRYTERAGYTDTCVALERAFAYPRDTTSFHKAAVSAYRLIIDQSGDDELAAKAMYLAAMAAKRNDDFDTMRDMLLAFVDRYDRHPLTADAYTELGWYELVARRDINAAVGYFETVDARYSDDNAHDNALNWLVIASLERGDVAGAAMWSARLASVIVSDRLQRKISDRPDRLAGYGRTGVTQKSFRGFGVANEWSWRIFGDDQGSSGVVITEVAPDSPLARAGVERGHSIWSLNGEQVNSSEALLLTLSSLPGGQSVQLSVAGKDVTLTVDELIAN